MTTIDAQGRPEPDPDADELTTLRGFLDFHRATLEWKTRDLDAAGLNATTGVSSMTLGGLLKHLAYVEDNWFSVFLHARVPELWRHAVDRSERALAEALASGGLDQPSKRAWPDGRTVSLRWILVHMIEEYARHNGHADLLREAIDGQTRE